MIENVIKLLAKSVLIPLRLAAASAGDPQIHKKILGSGRRHSFTFSWSSAPKTTTLIKSSDKMKDLIEIVISLEDSGDFGVEHIPKEIGNKNLKTNIFRIQAYNAILGQY